MHVATILGINYLHMAQDDDYHLCLAHLLTDEAYKAFFKEKSRRGDIVMMDNGVVETGLPMEWSLLKELGSEIEATEIILPDRIYNMSETIKNGEAAINNHDGDYDLLAVPQGRDFEEWRHCLNVMLQWPVSTIGISKFIAPFAPARAYVLKQVPELIESDKNIHILGCISVSNEVIDLEKKFPGRIRGIDSGIATICAQAGMTLSSLAKSEDRLDIPLDFFAKDLDISILIGNIYFWRSMCGINESIEKEEDND